jgi:Ca2+-binding EF-hand superfamily protein
MNYRPGEGEAPNEQISVLIRDRIMDGTNTMRQVFKEVDRDNSGFVDKREMETLLAKLQVKYTPAEFDAFYADFDKNDDGRFSYGEFVQLMQNKN